MNFQLKPNFKVAGPVMGSNIRAFSEYLSKMDNEEFLAHDIFKVTLGSENFEVTKDMVDVKITAKEGFAVAMENNVFTILDTTLNQELLDEGLAREVVSKVQQLRKQNDFEMMDRINIKLECDVELARAVKKHMEYIRQETLADDIIFTEVEKKIDINGHSTGIAVEKLQCSA